MVQTVLWQAAVLLAAAAVAAPLARAAGIGSVLGYLAAGILIGPFGLGLFGHVENILHIAELGIIFLLFLIGLELRLARLWVMRRSLFGAGTMQVAVTGLILGAGALAFNFSAPVAIVIGVALAMSSTAFVLQVLEERKELGAKHGRLAFSILLFQDLAAIPLIAVVPIIAAKTTANATDAAIAIAKAIGMIAAVILFGRLVLNRIYQLVAASGIREAMTATALLTVIGVAMAMQWAGLSAALGAFIAGAVLADSEYRHQIEADIQPFEGLLLGLFFTAIGMTLDLNVIVREPAIILALVAGLIVVKALVLYAIGRWQGLKPAASRRLALVLSQGGEFAFVILGLVEGARLMSQGANETIAVVVTLSMVATPLLLRLDDMIYGLRRRPSTPRYDVPPPADGHVIIAGFGRVGQIVARILQARHIPYTALDISPHQIALVSRFGNTAYFGDASRLDILEAAKTGRARAFVLAVDDVEASLKIAAVVRQHFPQVPIFARARNRQHVYRLMDLGVTMIRRETFLASLELTRDLLRGLGLPDREVKRITSTFATHDRKRLYESYRDSSNEQKMMVLARQYAEELEQLFREDAEENAAELTSEPTSVTARKGKKSETAAE